MNWAASLHHYYKHQHALEAGRAPHAGNSRQFRPHGKLALQWMRNRPSNLPNSTRGNPRTRVRTPLPADSRAFEDPEDGVGKDEAAQRLAWFLPRQLVRQPKSDLAERTQRARAGSLPIVPLTTNNPGADTNPPEDQEEAVERVEVA